YRYAKEWDERERPASLALKAGELRKAKQWLEKAPPHLSGEITPLQREFIAHSESVVEKHNRRRYLSYAAMSLVFAALAAAGVIAAPHIAERVRAYGRSQAPPPAEEHSPSLDREDEREHE